MRIVLGFIFVILNYKINFQFQIQDSFHICIKLIYKQTTCESFPISPLGILSGVGILDAISHLQSHASDKQVISLPSLNKCYYLN